MIGATQDEEDRRARRNIVLLMMAQALGASAPPIIVSLGGIIGKALADDPALATLPISLYHVGLALSTVPAAMLMRRVGRRAVYVLGALLGSGAALTAAWAVAQSAFGLFCAGIALAGFYGACVHSYRFAASDAVPPARAAQAVSRILVGGLIAGVLGPQVVIWTRDAWPAVPFAGSFAGQAVLALFALPLLALLRMPIPRRASVGDSPGRPLREIVRSPRFAVAVVAGVVSYGLMSFVMTAAPIAMFDCGRTVAEAALGIQWHVLAMFGPSFFTGRLIDRFGKVPVTAAGLVLIACSGLVALAGVDLVNFWGSLVLLGVGWNFGFIGATAMVVECSAGGERTKVQALNDFLIFGTVALASLGSGRLLDSSGWNAINASMLPLIGLVLVMLLVVHRRRPRSSNLAG